jgi:hypothetical protein
MKMESKLEWVRASDIEMRARRRDWNGWELLRGTTWLSYPAYQNGARYEFDLSRCTSSAQVLDFIMQIGGKTWATKECLVGLVYAFDDIPLPSGDAVQWGSREASR